MNFKKVQVYVPLLLAIAGVAVLCWWLKTDPSENLKISLPGTDNRGKSVDSIAENVAIGEYFQQSASGYSPMGETWPRFRGAGFDNISKSEIRLTENFSSGNIKTAWTLDLGEGHSGAAIYKGLAYILDYDEKNRADVLRCHSLTEGKELWRRWYNVAIKRNHGMSRTVPAVTDDYIVTVGPRGHVMCVNRSDGNFRWGIDIEKEFHSEIPFWYTGQCPLIDEGKAIIAAGGDALVVAVDCATGQILWKTPNPEGWKMSHSSIMPFTFGGRKMYVYSAVGGVCGIAADGPRAGEMLWSTAAWNHSVVAPSPVCMPDGKIFLTAGYGAGSMMLQLSGENNNFKVEILYEYAPKDGLASEQQTPIYFQGHLFGIIPKDGGPNRNQLACVDPSDTRKIIWSSGKEARFGLGPYLIADNKMFLLNDDAVLTIIRPSVTKYVQLGQIKAIEEGQDAWAPLAIADGYLILRDSKKMVCLNLNQ